MTRILCLLTLCRRCGPPSRSPCSTARTSSKWYTYLRDHGKDKDPNGNFTVKDGVLRISGQDFGGLITRDEYANYKVEAGVGLGRQGVAAAGEERPRQRADPPLHRPGRGRRQELAGRASSAT